MNAKKILVFLAAATCLLLASQISHADCFDEFAKGKCGNSNPSLTCDESKRILYECKERERAQHEQEKRAKEAKYYRENQTTIDALNKGNTVLKKTTQH